MGTELSPYEPSRYQTVRAWTKAMLPDSARRLVRQVRGFFWRLIYPPPRDIPFRRDFPWSSPNVWQHVVDFYQERSAPVVFEYGTGISSLHHIRNLMPLRGTYIGIEHDPDWFVHVLSEIHSYCVASNLTFRMTTESIRAESPKWKFCDTICRIAGPAGSSCTAKLRLRQPCFSVDPETATYEEFEPYVRSLDESCDVVVVDGRVRRGCVRHVLSTGFLRPGGLLALFEAGRGMKNWLGRPTLYGESDYQPEVQRLLALGGELCDGNGVDSWPGMSWRRTMGTEAFFYPAEACFLVRPAGREENK